MKSGSQDGYESVVVERTRSYCRDVNCPEELSEVMEILLALMLAIGYTGFKGCPC